MENTVVPETVEEVVEEKPKKKTSKKQVEEVAEAPQETVVETPIEPAGAPVEEKAEEKKAQQKTYVPKTETSSAPRAPRYFRNGQEQGVYVAKAGVETTQSNYGSTYRPRTQGAPSTRPQGGSFASRPATGGARPARPSASVAPVNAPMMPTREGKSFSAPAKKKTYEKTYTEKKALNKRDLVKQRGMTVEDFDEDKSGYRKVRSPKKQKRQEIPTIKIEHAVVTTQEIPLKGLSRHEGQLCQPLTRICTSESQEPRSPFGGIAFGISFPERDHRSDDDRTVPFSRFAQERDGKGKILRFYRHQLLFEKHCFRTCRRCARGLL